MIDGVPGGNLTNINPNDIASFDVLKDGAASAITGTLRELEEELGIKADKKDLKFIGSYARVNDYVEVFLLKSNVNVDELKLQDDEVQAAKWVSIPTFESIIASGQASDTGYFIFKEYYDKFYNTYLVFEDGKPVFKKKNEGSEQK